MCLGYTNKVAQKSFIIICVACMFIMILLYNIEIQPVKPSVKPQIQISGKFKLPNLKLTSAAEYLIETPTCRIPNPDPFNEDVKKFHHHEKYIPCSNKPLLSYIEKKNSVVTLHINETLLNVYNSLTKFSCCYSAVRRDGDDHVKYNLIFFNFNGLYRFSECQKFERSVNITDFIVLVKCSSLLRSEEYTNVHAIVDPQQINIKEMKITENVFSVLFVGIDSVSKMNLIRTMPKTYNFLESNDFINLKGYTKIADNTFPNLMAILTGRNLKQIDKHCRPKRTYMEKCDIIWDKFSKLGYITAYAEDETDMSIFNLFKKGFGKKPVDFYLRPYFLAAEKMPSIKRNRLFYCSGPETSGERVMNVAKNLASTFANHPTFGLFWMSSFSHNNFNMPSSMDDKLKEFLQEIYPHLEKTFFVFFSDHGSRYSNIRNTHTGYLEERLPFIYIRLPTDFRHRYPVEFENFVINSKRRLTTPYDLHMTLQDILSFANEDYEKQQSEACPKCHSLFEKVAETRTCEDAAIAEHWCVCSGYFYIKKNEPVVMKAVNFLLAELNSLISTYEETNYNCAIYNLKETLYSGISETIRNVEKNKTLHHLLLRVKTIPPAMFEATLEISQNKFRLLGDISRTDRYSDHSKCINSPLEKYCYCKGLRTSIIIALCTKFNLFC